MKNYNFELFKLGSFEILRLSKNATGEIINLSLYGGFILSCFVKFGDMLQNVIDGYKDENEIKEQNGARSCLMSPFSNRLLNGEYFFEGVRYKISSEIFPGNFIAHGFLRFSNFKILSIQENNEELTVVLFCDTIREENFSGYPFDVDFYLIMKYWGCGFELKMIAENIGNKNAPFSFGWHPYFKLNEEGINKLALIIPFKKVAVLDENYLPLQGNKALKEIFETDDYNFLEREDSKKNIIGTKALNYCYADPIYLKSGKIETELIDIETKRKLTIKQNRGVFYAFTGEGLKRDERKSIALEPVEFITNAFNREELKEVILLRPKEKRDFIVEINCETIL